MTVILFRPSCFSTRGLAHARTCMCAVGPRALDAWPCALHSWPRARCRAHAGPLALHADAYTGPPRCMPGRSCWSAAGCRCRAARDGWRAPGAACRPARAACRACTGCRAARAGCRYDLAAQGYIDAFCAAIAAGNAGHRSTPAYGGTAAATTLCPSCAAAATIFMKPQQRLPERRAASLLREHEIL